MNQESLFTPSHTKDGMVERPTLRPLSRAAQRGGSHDAADRSVESGMHASRCRLVLQHIVDHWRMSGDVLTVGELAHHLNIPRNELAKRVADLNAVGWIAALSRKRECKISGIACLQWEPTPMGLRGYDLGLPMPRPEKPRARGAA
jgi:hypothetical protein